MGLTTSMFSGLSGLAMNSQLLTVTGNNIANVNTTAFKSSRVTFESQISQTLNSGSSPTGTLGGTNPTQVGLGTRMGSIRRDFSSGGLQPTGVSTDMAVEGNGFFVLNVNGERRFTRDGGFILDRDFNLVAPGSGGLVQGYGVDDEFNVVDGVLRNINIPVGILTLAEPTTEVQFAGNLNSGGNVATQGALITGSAMFVGNGGPEATAADTLDSLFNAAGDQLFNLDDVITVTGATRGGASLPAKTFQIGPANTTGSDAFGQTVEDLMTFLDHVFGLDNAQNDAGVDIVDGQITINGNWGGSNDLTLADANFVVNQSTSPAVPLSFSKAQSAQGESVRTTFVTYDSLGNENIIDLSIVLETKSNSGTTWRFYAHSEDDSDLDTFLSSGVLTFDTRGQLISVTDSSITLDRENTGAFSPQAIALGFQDQFGSVTALADVRSQVSAINQDGSSLGTLEDFTVSEDGAITGVFSNGLLRTLGRIPLAMFANNEGLEEVGGNLYRPSVNSGIPTLVGATTGGSGKIIGRALELSNVELSDEFVNLISATTGFSASSRVVTTSDRLIQELLNVVR
jgi:flagellar hook protein FlgE